MDIFFWLEPSIWLKNITNGNTLKKFGHYLYLTS